MTIPQQKLDERELVKASPADRRIMEHPMVDAGVPFASPASAQICAALAVAQGQFRSPKRTKTATIRPRDGASYTFSYAPLDEIIDAVKDGLAANGLSRQQYLVQSSRGYFVRTVIWHASSEWIASDYPVMYAKEGAQAFAGGVTYARRYGLSLALGLAPEDDDDGNVAEGNTVVEIKETRGSEKPGRRGTRPQPQPQPRPEQDAFGLPPSIIKAQNDNNAADQQEMTARITQADAWLMEAAGKGGTDSFREVWRGIPREITDVIKTNKVRMQQYRDVCAAMDRELQMREADNGPDVSP